MAFTDEHLKDFKERIKARGYDWDIVNMGALVRRLEAAEELIESAGDLKRSEAAQDWLTAAGKR